MPILHDAVGRIDERGGGMKHSGSEDERKGTGMRLWVTDADKLKESALKLWLEKQAGMVTGLCHG